MSDDDSDATAILETLIEMANDDSEIDELLSQQLEYAMIQRGIWKTINDRRVREAIFKPSLDEWRLMILELIKQKAGSVICLPDLSSQCPKTD